MKIREARINDGPAIIEILNQAIVERKNAYLDIFDVESGMIWHQTLLKNAYYVCVYEFNHEIKGWGSLTPYRQNRGALKGNTEITFYVDRSSRGAGIGSSLVDHMETTAKNLGYMHSVAILLDDNMESQELLKKKNYETLGHFKSIARFPDKNRGHLYMWKELSDGQS